MRVFREFGVLAAKFHNLLSYTLMAGMEYMILSVCLIGHGLAGFASPIGINRLLKSVVIIYGKDCLFLLPQLPGNRR